MFVYLSTHYQHVLKCYRMAPEVIACDQDPTATYDQRVSIAFVIYSNLCDVLSSFCNNRVTSGHWASLPSRLLKESLVSITLFISVNIHTMKINL